MQLPIPGNVPGGVVEYVAEQFDVVAAAGEAPPGPTGPVTLSGGGVSSVVVAWAAVRSRRVGGCWTVGW